VFTPFPSNARPGNELQGANALGEGEFSAEKPKSPAEVENGTYFGMYTMPEAQQLKEKQLRLNTKFPDSLAASRLVRVVVSARMRPNIYGNAACSCSRLVNPTDHYDPASAPPAYGPDGEEIAPTPPPPSVVVLTNRQKRNGGPESKFHFDHVFSGSANQAEVYRTVAGPLIDNVMGGVNACVVAYGQTGAGKTHTVFGPSTDALRVTAEDARALGVIPRAAHDVFERIDRDKGKFEYKVYVTYMQLYLENIYDLIGTGPARTPRGGDTGGGRKMHPLKIREHNGKPYVAGLSVHRVTSAHQILSLLQKGSRKKVVAATTMNQSSSRSHAIFQVLIEKEDVRGGNSFEGRTLNSKFTCVDLAGSERASKTHPTGIQLRETKSINKSLCALGNTIASLSKPGRKKTSFVPWRDSKLTHLLCDALSGNSCVSLIVNIAPEDKHCPETMNSLLFGTRAKKVTLSPSANENIDYETMAKWLQTRLDETVDGLREEKGKAKAREQLMLAEFNEKLSEAEQKGTDADILERTLMEQIELNQELSTKLEVIFTGSDDVSTAQRGGQGVGSDRAHASTLTSPFAPPSASTTPGTRLTIEEYKGKLAAAEKNIDEMKRKEKLQVDVQALRAQVENLLTSEEEMEELKKARKEIQKLKYMLKGKNAKIRELESAQGLGGTEGEELKELRNAVELFTKEREQLISGHAKQRDEWARALAHNYTGSGDGGKQLSSDAVVELENTLEIERTSFWKTMEDTNSRLAHLEIEHEELALENKELRRKLSTYENQTESSVKKIRSILSNRHTAASQGAATPRFNGTPRGARSPSGRVAGFSEVVNVLRTNRDSPTGSSMGTPRSSSSSGGGSGSMARPRGSNGKNFSSPIVAGTTNSPKQRIHVKRSGSVYIEGN
jgi:kinesin family protein 5